MNCIVHGIQFVNYNKVNIINKQFITIIFKAILNWHLTDNPHTFQVGLNSRTL